MSDIVERLEDASNYAGNVFDGIFQDSKKEIESIRQQLADWERRSESRESKLGQLEANEALIECQQQLADTQRLLAESQARDEERRVAILEVLSLPNFTINLSTSQKLHRLCKKREDSTALDAAIAKAKRDGWLAACDALHKSGFVVNGGELMNKLRRMADSVGCDPVFMASLERGDHLKPFADELKGGGQG